MTAITHLRWDASLDAYEHQAAELLAAHAAGSPSAIDLLHENLPRFLDTQVTWLPRPITDQEIGETVLTIDDARLALARWYSFRDWDALAGHARALDAPQSPVREFERAAEAVLRGDAEQLRAMMRANPALVRARSTRITCHDPPVHGATLLHYLAANGIEGHRQTSPANAVEMARLLLTAGAEVDALAGMYGGQHPTMSMLVSSSPPAHAGVQVPLVHVLLDHGADPEGAGEGAWRNPVLTALVFGFVEAADALAARGALVDTLEKAAGLGRVADAAAMLPRASSEARHRALALAAITGRLDIVRMLLAAGEDPDRLNPDGFHSHATPLHQAALAGHLPLVRLLVEHGARIDICDSLWHGTALGWAEHGGQAHVVSYLRALESTAP